MADGIATMDRAVFTAMAQCTQDDCAKIMTSRKHYRAGLPDRVLAHLTLLDGHFAGCPVDRLTHSLQSASRAYRASMDEEYVVCALLHDIGDILTARDHGEIGAAILRPFVSDRSYWMVKHHTIFSGYYFLHHIGGDRYIRERLRGHPHFQHTAHFVDTFDQSAFDTAYDTMPLEAFAPMVHRLLEAPRRSEAAPWKMRAGYSPETESSCA